MEPSIYSFSLCTALPLMLFFGFYFLFAKTPEKKIFKNYLRSRQIMGIAMLLLSANYSVHFFFGIRFKNADSAILMNMSTYFLCYSLFSSALIMLLDRFYITKRRVWTHIILWIIFSTLSGVVLFLLPSGIMQKFSLFALAAWLVVFGVVLARRVIIAYRRAIRIFNETQADDIGAYIEWLSIFTYWALIFGVGCGLLTFLPDEYVFIWILSSIPFYSYLFYSYQNYLLFYEQVENAFEQDIQSEEELLTNSETEHEIVSEKEVPKSYTEFIERVDNWIKTDGYVQQGLTIKELSEILYTNRTYLSAYIKTTYKMTFREWITSLRLEYAKNILKEHPEINIQKLAESSGFLSQSNFIKLFSEKEGCTPAKWKKSNRE
ncbi:transcriptional regulator [Bacteroides ovatus]|jgi:AraC-like DNA-binding protein|nr:transcriptional activator FtrA [Bacteroides ovatus]SDZ47259.1 AraC-type DNA-binding protein [Bacteroides ovatus]SQA51100.1 transcriptional regulator [Bacteroides ovatus]